MPADRKPTRYAHADGHTDVCYSEDGQKLVTCGTDGDIRVWSGFEDVDPVQTCVGEWALCVRQKGCLLFVATDNNDVQKMTFPDAERDGLLVRFTCHVTHMALTKAHDVIAVVSEDMSVKVINLGDASSVFTFSELKGPPLSVALCPKAKLLAVSCGDGWLRIWNLENQTQVKGLECVPKANTFTNADLLCRMDFEPNSGHTLAYPEKNTIVILDVSDWSMKFTLTCLMVSSSYSICQYSPCGKYMAAAAQNGDLVIWEIVTQTVSHTKHSSEVSLSSMVWNPSGNGEIAYCDVYGQLGIVTGCTEVVTTASCNFVVDEAAEKGQVDFSGYEFVNDDDDDEDNENAISLEKLKQDVMGPLEPELDFDRESRRSRSPTPRPRTPETPMQPPFMPSSTPEHLNPRYMCWNEVGIIRSYGTDSDEDDTRSIEVEFHDASLHSSMMMQNYHGYTMGSLSVEVLLVANTSQITAIPLSSGSKEWTLGAGDDGEIVCVACSEKLVCFAMTNYLVRVCSVYGTQKGVLLAPGPVISMSASGYHLLIAYHSAAPRKGDQCVSTMLVKLEGLTVESKSMNIALQPETTILWLGFTDAGTPAIQDSFGMLYLHPTLANLWIPFCNTSKHSKNPTDGFFVTAIYESLQSVWGIRCRGSNYPGFTPRPTVGELPLEPPFAEADTEKSQLEAGLFAWSTLKVESVERKFKEAALKTFALACKNDLDQRALELIELIANPQLVTLATKYSTKQNKRRLSEKLMELALKFRESENEECSTTKKHDESAVIGSNMPRFVLNKQKSKSSKEKVQSVSDAGTSLINISTLEETSYSTDTSLTSLGNLTDTQESLFSNPEPRNPFLKSNKQVKPGTSNPLSLTDKYAGYTIEEPKKEKENRNSLNNSSGSEKRKQSDFESDKQKQSKLAKFMFSKKE